MKKYTYWFILVGLAFNYYSCVPKNEIANSGLVHQTFLSTSESDSTCENKIRDQIEQKSFHFVGETSFQQDIDKANELIDKNSVSETYNFAEVDRQIQYIKKTQSYTAESFSTEISFELGLNVKNSVQPMYFEITSEQKSENEKTEISQRYSVNSKCELNLNRTVKSHLQLIGSNLNYDTKTIADNEVIEDLHKNYNISSEKILIDFLRATKPQEIIDILSKSSDLVSLIPSIGIVDIETENLPNSTESAFGSDFDFGRKQMSFKYNNSTLIKFIFQYDIIQNVGLMIFPDQNKKTWTLPKEFKNKISLGQAQLGSFYFDSKLSSEYQNTSKEYLVQTNKDFIYKNIAGYFSTTFIEEKNGFKTFKLQEKYPPVFTDQVIPEDLEVNSTIQSDLPEIQKIAQDILLKSNDRKQQIGEILKYLSKNYIYDHDMVDKDKVRPLTTKEALDRKKGVCQHYAVIFTAIARALKIPSRIVIGYLVKGESAGMHAWVESEVELNQWQVIEPQSDQGLETTRTRFYFPLLRGLNLENKDAKDAVVENYFLPIANLKLIATPVQSLNK